jgi:Ser/Thr protein kinase RdoA (MazF antagonist)
MQPDLIAIASRFQISSSVISVEPTGSGHIHKTYLVRTDSMRKGGYILQKINHQVFQDVELLMKNISLITNYLSLNHAKGDFRPPPRLISTLEGTDFFMDDSGAFWRMFRYIEGSRTYDQVRDPKMAFQAGSAYGDFIHRLSAFPVEKITPVLLHFHSLQNRYEQYLHAIDNAPKIRLKETDTDRTLVNNNIEKFLEIPRLTSQGRFPLRLTHNDTKINNVLFDDTEHAICVIDLDTVMPGLILYDFGDAMRTTAATAPEDEQTLERIGVSIPMFEAFSHGFLAKLHALLTQDEVDYLVDSTMYISFMQGLRFLTDHLNEDQYFSIRYPGHNLVRARAQFRLTECFVAKKDELQTKIRGICQQLSVS